MSKLSVTPKQASYFWGRVHVDEWSPNACWEHQGKPGPNGYINTTSGGVNTGAHRIAYMLAVGYIPGEAVVRHKCDNKACCRPDHLELGTPTENRRDSIERGNWKPESCGRRLTEGQVVDMRWRRHYLGESLRSLAERFGCTTATAQRVYLGQSYPGLPGPTSQEEVA